MPQPHLQKTIGLWSATTIVIGTVIGSNIFMKPATMAGQLGSPVFLIIVWIVAGIISIFGAMAFAELGTMFPETGGQYIYLRKAYGDFVAYLYGWGSIAVINTAAIAAIAFVCAEYAGDFIHLPRFNESTEHSMVLHVPMVGDILPLQNFGVKMLAISIIMFLTIANYLSVQLGNAIQFISTLLKALALIILVFGILFSGKGSTANFITNSNSFHLTGWSLFAAFMAATTGAFAAYDGWNNLNMVGGEIKNPSKNITKSLLMGLFACIAIYVLITLSYMYVLPIDEMAKSSLVATDATAKVYGSAGGTIIAILIVVSTFGATSVNLLANARVVFAMSEAKSFFRWAGVIHLRFRTPGNSVLVLGIWSSLFVLSGSFDILADMFIFMSWIFYGLVVLGVFILRKKMPEAERPYRIKGYPVVPAIFILFTCFYLGTTIYNDITNYVSGKSPFINSFFGMLLTATGIPLYFYFRKRDKKEKR
ncbi:MAG TPA: amino acid permease [Chitinophagaceae bacterium]|jgi:APA family basic amino acid/polyamine antiporter|nr:amino acid permease [Chitinophagaceae bacterium]